jgi:hypothetical protein
LVVDLNAVPQAAERLLDVYILGPIVVALAAYAFYATRKWVHTAEKKSEDRDKLQEKYVALTLKNEEAMRLLAAGIERMGDKFDGLGEAVADQSKAIEQQGKVIAEMRTTTDSIIRDAVRGRRFSPPPTRT